MGLLVLLPNAEFPFQQDRAILIDPNGNVVWIYDKAHPTPGPEAAFTAPGPGIVPITDTPLGRIASVICFDMDFPWLVRQGGQAHADLLIAPSLDWDTAKRSHAQLASIRAVENGVSLVRPSGDGISQAVDHQGRVLAAADSFATDKAVFLTSVPMHRVATVYAVIGDSFAYLSSWVWYSSWAWRSSVVGASRADPSARTSARSASGRRCERYYRRRRTRYRVCSPATGR